MLDENENMDSDLAVITGKVKWFSLEKGYGFVEIEGHLKDTFLHVRFLHQAGIDPSTVFTGTEISFFRSIEERGPVVRVVVSIDNSAVPNDNLSQIDGIGPISATLKWYDGVKGFGFVQSSGIFQDIFFHVNVLGRDPFMGETFTIWYKKSRKGLEVTKFG